ncbi:hypothetical protein E1212_17925 [Jiangella ureilytica]|uniref:Uncharacterized protein n=1 Tax=Jiangella ureilytica TaxID=2530374 RepID=A0A4R4RJC2_9ACTN|nr:hypothetical protein [Jiangella ureilytica]TDC49550.1 hypothetical protein E1212_17925 [Jiangella ureilytica]
MALIALGLALLAVVGLGGVVLQRQGERIDELEATIAELRTVTEAAAARRDVDDATRLDEIEAQLGFGAPDWPSENVAERITQLEWDLGLICGFLHRTGEEVLC